MIPDDGVFGYAAPIHSPGSRAYGPRREGRDPYTNGLNVPGASEPQDPSVRPVVDGRACVSNGDPRRKQLYADGFVRPVGLGGSGALGHTPRHHQTENEPPDNIVLASPQDRPRFESRVIYPGHDVWVNVPQDTVYDGGKRTAGRSERQYPSVIRYGWQWTFIAGGCVTGSD